MTLSQKDPAEKIDVTFDFSNSYTTVTNPIVTVSLSGTLVDISEMKGSSPIITDSNKVVILIQGGESGTKYDLRCTVDTDTDETVVAKDILFVKTL